MWQNWGQNVIFPIFIFFLPHAAGSLSLSLSFSSDSLTSLRLSLVLETLNLSPKAGRTVLGFNQWLLSNSNFTHDDETLSYFIGYFGRRKDIKASHEVLVSGRGIAGPKTLETTIDRLVRARRPTQAVSFFEKMDTDYGFQRNRNSLRLVVEKLCEKGYVSYAKKMVKNLADEFIPDESICDLLIKGWCLRKEEDEDGENYFLVPILRHNFIFYT